MSVAIKALTMPGEKVLILSPDYNCFFSSIRNNGCEVSESVLRFTRNNTFEVDWQDFEARCADEKIDENVEPMDLFYKACALYPRMFIALVETEKSGCWLTATPEILLDGEGQDWRTIALAGTMKLEGDQLNGEGEPLRWSTKNIQEQRIVATYITECLEQFTGDFREEGPRTVRAANLVHLRSDFTFKLENQDHIGDLLQTLHPTPAVCGLPKREAFQFITRNEHSPRRYYSGFMGPLGQQTHLYVSLRCMNIERNVCHLYAGGGLLKDSTEEQEWTETEAKMETMRRLLYVQ
jgi:isochorismate synthase